MAAYLRFVSQGRAGARYTGASRTYFSILNLYQSNYKRVEQNVEQKLHYPAQ